MTFITRLLSTPFAAWLSILAAIGARVVMQIYFLNIGGDRAYQLVATRNFIQGNGLTINQVFAANLSTEQFLPLVGWPPGYSFLLAPFYFIWQNNFGWAVIAVDVLTVSLFILFARKILALFNVSKPLLNAYTLLTGFFIYDFSYSSTTDFVSLSLFLIAIWLTLRHLKNESGQRSWLWISLALYACVLVRYMYIPVVFIIPAYFVLTGWMNKNKPLRYTGFKIALLLGLLLAVLLLFQQKYTGAATYMIPSKKGFFPENIARMNPFVYSTFANLVLLCGYLERFTGIGYIQWVNYARWTNFIPFVALLAGFFIFYQKKKFRQLDLNSHYTYLGSFISFAIIGLLAALSLRNAAITTNTYPLWTFVEEPRYYAFVVIFLQQLVFIYLFARYKTLRFVWLRRTALLLAAVLLLESLHGVYYTTKILLTERQQFYADKTDHALVSYTFEAVQALKQQHPGKIIVVTSPDPSFCNLANLAGASGLYQASEVDAFNLQSTRPAVLLAVIREQDKAAFTNFINRPGTTFLKKIYDHNFFVADVSARP